MGGFDAAEAYVVAGGFFFAFAAGADEVAGAVLGGAEEGTAAVDAFLFGGFCGVVGGFGALGSGCGRLGGRGLWVMLVGQLGGAVCAVGFFGVWRVRDNVDLARRLLYMAAYHGIADYIFATMPLFVLMGLLVSISNVGKDTFTVAEYLLRKVRGGLGVATVAANTVFAAVTGVSIASAAVFTRVAVPEMVRHGYKTTFATGTVAGRSVLGLMIPPSPTMSISGLDASQSIGYLFHSGVFSGLLLDTRFCSLMLC